MVEDLHYVSRPDLRRSWALAELAIAGKALRTVVHSGHLELLLGISALSMGLMNEDISTAFAGAGMAVVGTDRMIMEWERRSRIRKKAPARPKHPLRKGKGAELSV